MKIPFNRKFDYPELAREQINGYRHYVTPNGYAPSVTTILSNTKSEESKKILDDWIAAVGTQTAEKIKTEAANVGTVVHKLLEEYCLGIEKPLRTNLVYKIAYPMAQTIIQQGLIPHMSEIIGSEVAVHYDILYAGTTDLVGIWDGKLSIIDFKQSNKEKLENSAAVDDYKCQLAAYAIAHNEMFGTDIQHGVILMSTRDCKYLQFSLNDHYETYASKWLDKVEEYHLKLNKH